MLSPRIDADFCVVWRPQGREPYPNTSSNTSPCLVHHGGASSPSFSSCSSPSPVLELFTSSVDRNGVNRVLVGSLHRLGHPVCQPSPRGARPRRSLRPIRRHLRATSDRRLRDSRLSMRALPPGRRVIPCWATRSTLSVMRHSCGMHAVSSRRSRREAPLVANRSWQAFFAIDVKCKWPWRSTNRTRARSRPVAHASRYASRSPGAIRECAPGPSSFRSSGRVKRWYVKTSHGVPRSIPLNAFAASAMSAGGARSSKHLGAIYLISRKPR